ncbi:hypothetical protein ACEWY4_016555 [Coilia grayii]|uniref:PDZ domain-containing protein n=1 Tax=Coilia grayii TaxID=363190 RepID=A0ABD1JKT3_9TELE
MLTCAFYDATPRAFQALKSRSVLIGSHFKLTDGGKAAKAKISVGDTVLSIDGIATEGMTHLEAQNKIKACTGNLNLTLQK